jgi:hypothetical protein
MPITINDMGKLNWNLFVNIWRNFGIEPEEASEILVKNWLDKNYTTFKGNIWKDKRNIKLFKDLVKFIYAYQKHKKLRWIAAIHKLVKTNNVTVRNYLIFLKLQGDSSKIELSPVTCSKLLGQFRQEFIDNGWLDSFDKPEIRIEKTLRRAKLLKKKKPTSR